MCGKTWKNPEPRAVALLETPHPWTMLWQPLPGTLGPQAAKKKKEKSFMDPKKMSGATRCFTKQRKYATTTQKKTKCWRATSHILKSHRRQQNISLNKRKYVTFPVWHKLQHNASCNLLGKGSQFIIKQMATKYFRLLLKMATYSQFKQVATCIYISLENDVTLRIHTDTEMFHIIITLENAVICNALGLKHNPQHTLWKLYHIHNSLKYRNVLCHKKSETRMT